MYGIIWLVVPSDEVLPEFCSKAQALGDHRDHHRPPWPAVDRNHMPGATHPFGDTAPDASNGHVVVPESQS